TCVYAVLAHQRRQRDVVYVDPGAGLVLAAALGAASPLVALVLVVLPVLAALERQVGRRGPGQVHGRGVERVLHPLRAQADLGQGPAGGIGRVDAAVVERRQPVVAAVVPGEALGGELRSEERRVGEG